MRKPISTRSRFEIFKRDKFACQYCGQTPPTVILHVDHIVPVCSGGTNSRENLITACDTCNMGKSGVPLTSVFRPLRDTIKEERERQIQVAEYNALLKELKCARDADYYIVSDAILSAEGKDPSQFEISQEWSASVKSILRRLPVQKILEAVEIAHDRFNFQHNRYKTWKYFCGVCWRMVERSENRTAP